MIRPDHQTAAMRKLLLLGCALLVTGCIDPVQPPVVPCDPLLLQFSNPPGDTITTPEGIRYVDFKVGSGDAARVGSSVYVNYSLYRDGQPTDSSCPAGKPVFNTIIGSGRAIPGFELGIIGMQTDGVRRVIVPSELGYKNGELVFDIELVSIL